MIERLQVRIPAAAAGEFSPPESSFVLTLIRCPFNTRVTVVARKRPRPSCQKCRWQITPRLFRKLALTTTFLVHNLYHYAKTTSVRACHTPRLPLHHHPSGHLGGWATLWLAEEMLDGQHQRVNIPAHARTTHKGLLQKRLGEDLC